jgi:opacity protein-like surface antigen
MTVRCEDETKPKPRRAPATEGLNRLDLDRAASLADEGGTAGAIVEAQAENKPASGPTAVKSRNRKRMLKAGLFALALHASAASANAGAYVTPFVGAAFGGRTSDSKVTYGGSLMFAGESGILGFAVDFGYTPHFFGSEGLGSNNVTTLMGDLVLLSPGRTRLYGSAGVGLLKTRVEDASGFFNVDSNELGFNAGGGILFMAGDHLGIQGDVRYFRQLTDPTPDDGFDIDLGNLDFWRATGGLAIRF